jgi:cephalosporin hydroxylase
VTLADEDCGRLGADPAAIRSDKAARLSHLVKAAAGRVRRGETAELARYLRRYRRTPALRALERRYRASFRMTLRRWLEYHQSQLVFDRCSWMGVTAWKNPLDAWIYQEILHEVRPDVVVEIGSAMGGGTLYLAHMLELLGHGIVISVDIDRTRFDVEHARIVTVTGDSSSVEVVQEVAALCRDKRVLVIHDADHEKAKVLADLAAYAPLVSVGSYLIVEDGIVDLFRPHDILGVVYEGPLAATEEFRRRAPQFEVDTKRERYLLTYNPQGFLRRVK